MILKLNSHIDDVGVGGDSCETIPSEVEQTMNGNLFGVSKGCFQKLTVFSNYILACLHFWDLFQILLESSKLIVQEFENSSQSCIPISTFSLSPKPTQSVLLKWKWMTHFIPRLKHSCKFPLHLIEFPPIDIANNVSLSTKTRQ